MNSECYVRKRRSRVSSDAGDGGGCARASGVGDSTRRHATRPNIGQIPCRTDVFDPFEVHGPSLGLVHLGFVLSSNQVRPGPSIHSCAYVISTHSIRHALVSCKWVCSALVYSFYVTNENPVISYGSRKLVH